MILRFSQRALLVFVLAASFAAAVFGRRAGEPPARAHRTSAPIEIELLPGDVVRVQRQDLTENLDLSGTLRATNQAVVKAKVAGEVRAVLVQEGQAVTKGQLLVGIDNTDYLARVKQAQGALLAARGQLDIARKAQDINRNLQLQGFISRNASENASSQYTIASANHDSAAGALELAQKALADTQIRAPLDGLVSRRSVEPGEKVSVDTPLLAVVDLGRMELEASVPASDVSKVTFRQVAAVRIEGIATPLTGRVSRINPSVEPGSRSIIVHITLDGETALSRILRDGMFGVASLAIAQRQGVLAVPRSAVREDEGGSFVYIVEHGRIGIRRVTLGVRGNDDDTGLVQVVTGTEAGAIVLRRNLGVLQDRAPVRFMAEGAARPASAAASRP